MSSDPGMFATSPPVTVGDGGMMMRNGCVSSQSGLNVAPSDLKYSFPKANIKVLLLENIHSSAVGILTKEGFSVETVGKALSEEELIARISDVHVIGIRSKTKLTESVLEHADKLLAIGCFCIGTDQVDLEAAEKCGVPVFNAPFSNTRSVAELVISEIVALSRRLCDRSNEMHEGTWNKSAIGCNEIRGKTCGIVGYGHIGTQVSVMAEAMGMQVLFYDVVPQLPLGNSRGVDSLDDLLVASDYVTLHVPRSDLTSNMIAAPQLAKMKAGSYLINNSRGTVVDVDALAEALRSGHIGGCAIDVFPSEPEKNGPHFSSPLQGCPNTILSPHIGGSTAEAQEKIGEEVANLLVSLVNRGSTLGSVNLPNLELHFTKGCHRILNIHQNVPGVLRDINNIFASLDTNVRTQVLGTTQHTGYLIVDVEKAQSTETKEAIAALPVAIRTRILY